MVNILLRTDNQEDDMDKRLKRFGEIVMSSFILILLAILIGKYFFSPKTLGKWRSKDNGQHFSEIGQIPETMNYSNQGDAMSIPVLLYHGIKENPVTKGDVSIEKFQQHMIALKKAGYQTIKLDDFYDFVRGKKKLPDKSFLLTFDDGSKSSYYPSDHVLRDFNYSAVMYVITGHSLSNKKSSYYLNETELKEMLSSGRWELQSHGKKDHDLITINPQGEKGRFLSNRMWLKDQNRFESDEEFRERIRNDLKAGRDDIARVFGITPISFAFPAGDYGTENTSFPGVTDIIVSEVKLVFSLAFYQFRPESAEGFYRNNYPIPDGTSLYKRIKLNNGLSPSDLINTLNASAVKTIPYKADFSNDRDWILISGKKAITSDALTIYGEGEDRNSIVYLDGTQGWTNYRIDAQIDTVAGNNFSIVSRSLDGLNYLSCNFSKDSIRLSQTINDSATVLAQTSSKYSLLSSNSVGMFVDGNKASCLANGSILVVTSQVSSKLSHGSIGFKIWNSLKGEMKLKIQNLYVQEIN